jgi:hypothetical protein
MAACDACSVIWNLGTNSAFALRTEENHGKSSSFLVAGPSEIALKSSQESCI